MSKVMSTQKTMVALAAASMLIGTQAMAGEGPGNPTCDTGSVRTVNASLKWALDTDGDTTANIGPFPFGTAATDSPIVGDWDNNGTANVGVARAGSTGAPNSMIWRLDTNNGGNPEIKLSFGKATDVAVPGRYAAAAAAPVSGVTRAGGSGQPNSLVWKLDTAGDGGSAETTIVFGEVTDTPIVGDWDGDGTDNIGVVRKVSGLNKAFLDTNGGGTAEIVLNFGPDTSAMLACDWDGDLIDDLTSVGPGANTLLWKLDTANNGGTAEQTRNFGDNTDTPVAGDWDAL